MADLIKDTNNKFQDVIVSFESRLKSIHSGSAHAGLVEDIMVNHYNSVMPLKQVASIMVSSPTQLAIRPWDAGALVPIETALREAGRNFNPSNDGAMIRITLPPMSGERRKELAKLVHRQAEEAKVALRSLREETLREIKTQQRGGVLTEDDRYRSEKELNELISEFNGIIDKQITVKLEAIEG